MVKRLKARYNVDVDLVEPRVPYRETIKAVVKDVEYKHKKQTGGHGQYGHVHLRIEPLKRGQGFEFLDEIVGGVVPNKFIPAVEKGVIECMKEGVVAGYPVVDIRVALHYGSYHDVDSSEMAFKIAGIAGLPEGLPGSEADPARTDLQSRSARSRGCDGRCDGRHLIAAREDRRHGFRRTLSGDPCDDPGGGDCTGTQRCSVR